MTTVEVASCGTTLPAVGLGCWKLRSRQCRDTVTLALDQGYRHLDTARFYGNEVDVGRGIQSSSVPRDQVFLATKLWIDETEPAALRAATEDSLKKLATDYVDLLMLHWPTPSVPLADTLGAMLELRAAGKIRYLGLSNFPARELRQALEITGGEIYCNQVEFHPYLAQTTLLQVAEDTGVPLVAYRPLLRGEATVDPVIVETAARLSATPAQTVLAWLRQKGRVATIPKTCTPARLEENLASLALTLDDEAMTAVDRLACGRRTCLPDYSPAWDA